ncbi:MAG: MSMEG_4193 family putative phosphomutase [Actinomycetota bacterium]|nr:MSMEG_4193 family putative phosphomutase [Actinomycetota bacterium]
MTTLYLVRHAVTDHTGQRLSGWAEGIPLTAAGRDQAAALAQHLAPVPLEAIYSSPIDRTLETARTIARPHRITVRVRKGIGEVDYGTWTGRSLRSLARTKLWQEVLRQPSAVRFPEGETLHEVQTRAVAEIERMRTEHADGVVCCVSHGDVIKLVIAHYTGVHIDLFQRLVVAPASVSRLVWGRGGPRLVALNPLVSSDLPGSRS